jgi:hypothetical protein
MKNLTIAIALVAASASTAVFADGATYEYPDHFASNVSRAAVQADAAMAQKAGLIVGGEINHVAQPSPSQLTRAQVVAEAREAQRLGLIGGGELSPVATPEQQRAIQVAGERAVADAVMAARR